jgi:hypothetical protein
MANVLDQPERWRERARESRHLANGMPDAESRRIMLDIADSYDRLARRADERARLARLTHFMHRARIAR